MTENPNQNESQGEFDPITSEKPRQILPISQSQKFQGIDQLNLLNQTSSDLAIISENLSKRIIKAIEEQNPEEVQKWIDITKGFQAQIERQKKEEYAEIEVKESQNNTNFNRKKEVISIFASIGAIAIGIWLYNYSSSFAPILILLGFVKLLGYSLKEIRDFFFSNNISSLTSQKNLKSQKQDENE